MAAVKKKSGAGAGYDAMRADLAAGTLGTVYIFHGEESYLREYYLTEIRKSLVPAGFEEFNFHKMEGKGLSVQTLTETAEAMPMMAERTMIQINDWDLFKLNEEQRNGVIALLEDFPPYCCLILVYDQIEYKPSKTSPPLCNFSLISSTNKTENADIPYFLRKPSRIALSFTSLISNPCFLSWATVTPPK